MVNTDVAANAGWPSVGMKCVCIDKFEAFAGEQVPSIGQTLTVRAVEKGASFSGLFLMFEELNNDPSAPHWDQYGEINFHVDAFRPLIDTREAADLKMFQEIADSTNTPLVRYWDRMNDVAAYGGEGVGE